MNATTLTGLTLAEAAVRLDEQLPPDAYKPVPGGADLTDIDPNHMRKVLNEIFGVCGYGWGYQYNPETIRSRTEVREGRRGDRTVIVVTLAYLKFWYKLLDGDELIVCEVPATGSSENSNDAYALKGALTNAIGNAVSNIGFQQSVYLGKRDHRTVNKKPSAAASASSVAAKASSGKRKPAPAAKAAPKAKSEVVSEPSGNGDPGSHIVPFGAGIKGQALRDLPPDKLDWLANQMAPFNQAGKQLQARAREYLESLEAVA